MYIDAKSARCWKYSPEDPQILFPPGSGFQPSRQAVSTGLSFINTSCTQSELHLPILMENNKNHQITLPRGRIGFSSLDVLDREEPKYQIRSPYELTDAIIATDERYSDCFLLHSTIPVQSGDEFLQIVYGNENSIIQQPNSIGHCISADAKMRKGFADFFSHKIPGLRPTCEKAKLPMGQVLFLGFYRQTLYLQSRDETTIFRQTGLVYSSDNSQSNKVSRSHVWSFYNRYTEDWLRIRSNELGRNCKNVA